MRTITSILVPTDFSDAADEALHYATVLAVRLDTRLSLLHVFDPFVQPLYWDGNMPIAPDVHETILNDIQLRLAERALIAGRAHATTSVVSGIASRAIVEHARDTAVDLIVMGTHGRHGMAHLLLGSVAERVVRTASCPVLTVRSARVALAPEQCLVEACPA